MFDSSHGSSCSPQTDQETGLDSPSRLLRVLEFLVEVLGGSCKPI